MFNSRYTIVYVTIGLGCLVIIIGSIYCIIRFCGAAYGGHTISGYSAHMKSRSGRSTITKTGNGSKHGIMGYHEDNPSRTVVEERRQADPFLLMANFKEMKRKHSTQTETQS